MATIEHLRGWLRTELARLLEVGPDDVREDDRFAKLGLDSLRATALAGALSDTLGAHVSPALLWAYPTVSELARHLTQQAPAETTVRRISEVREEAVAVIGMACRFPGAGTLDEFWQMLLAGTDAVKPVPSDRWVQDPALAGVPGEAGFLDHPVDAFDPLFFEISPREAAEIDPQHRLFLEVAWEALEQAGVAGDALKGSRTGVFAGAIWHDYGDLHGTDIARLSQHSATGQALSMVANRLSYVLGLRGPSMTLDSACSSSLLSVHLACQSIRSGESEMAVAGGVNLLLSLATMASLTRFGGLSPDGRCKAFDASGDGFGRGEGCGVVVLKPLSRALADGDRIWCVIKGSAANNDGPSNGLTAPNPLAQQDVIRDAGKRAGVSPADIHFVETHGTGTSLGDPIEASALGAVLGAARPAGESLVIGSVKTNLGHLEGAAGIAGLIKTALCLHHGQVPPNLHFNDPNPHIDFDALRLRVPTAVEDWPQDRRLAGVSSFGWGGTNVHVVLGGWAEPAPLPPFVPAHYGDGQARVAFVCSPHGHQWAGMGRLMLRTEPVFRSVLERCDRELAQYTGWSLLDELFASEDAVRYDDVSVSQPIQFAVQVALAAWLESRGVSPDAVAGHSLGEISAAVIAGFLSIPEATRLVYHYSRYQREVSGRGEGMAVIELPAVELASVAAKAGVVVAAHNGPRSTALAGSVAALEELLVSLKARGVLCAMIKVNLAAHSPAIDEVMAGLMADVGDLAVTPGRIPMISTVIGAPVDVAQLDAAYFARNLRQPVLLADATAKLLADGHNTLVELSANPVLLSALQQSVQDAGGTATVLGTMTRGDDDRAGVWETLLELDELGAVRPVLAGSAELFTLSAKTTAALRASAVRMVETLARRQRMPDLSTAAERRADHPYRLAAVAGTSVELADVLRDYAEGSSASGMRVATRPAGRPKVAFVFPGQGSQWIGMGRELLAREPVFHAAIRECDAAIARFADWSLLEELRAHGRAARLDRIDVVQPTLFAMEVALAKLWQSWGIRPDAVVGHSMGEVAASYIAGAVSLDDAARVICRRSRLMRQASGQGAMLAAELTMDEAAAAIGEQRDLVSIAVSNSRRSTVLSGDRAALTSIAEELTRREVFCRWVKVDVASHSPQMDDLRDDLLRLLDGVSGQPPRIPMYSTVTGQLAQGTEMDTGYWFRNLRLPVMFGAQIENLARAGHTVFVEMSPHPILLPAVQQVAADAGTDVTVLPSLRRGEPARRVLLDSLGALYVLGAPVRREQASTPGRRGAVLPAYPWQRERYRLEVSSTRPRNGSLLGDRLDSAVEPGTHYWQPELDWHTAAIGDHVIGGRVIVPASAYLDMALRAARDVLPIEGGFEANGLRFRRPFVVGESGSKAQIVLARDDITGSATVRFYQDGDDGFACVAEMDVSTAVAATRGVLPDIAEIERELADGVPGEEFYARLAQSGLAYGPAYQRVQRIACVGQEAFARIAASPRPAGECIVDPMVLDAALQTAVAPVLDPANGLVSARIERVVVHKRLAGDCYAHTVVRPHERGFTAELLVYGLSGELLVEASGIALIRSAPVTPAGEGTLASAGGESRPAGLIPAPVRDSLIKMPRGAQRLAAIEMVTAECVAIVARIPATGVDPEMPLRSLGISSLMALELRNQLEGRFEITLSATVILNHPTVRQLAPLVARQAGISLDDAVISTVTSTVADPA
jgi:acyl transferase domain-containing protein/acyl carrier protein